jgi:tetratricopeptide (TPR) repeat protein
MENKKNVSKAANKAVPLKPETLVTLEEQKEQDYQKLVNLMNCIKCMPDSNSKVDMYQQVAAKFESLSDYKEAKEYGEQCNKLAIKTDEAVKKEVYEIAHIKKKKARHTADYKLAAENFKEVSGYLDADALALECEQLIERIEIKNAKKRLIKFGAAVVIILALVVGMQTSHAKYYLANTFMFTHSYDLSINMYKKLGPYKDCTERLAKSEYLSGEKEKKKGNFEKARKAFAEAGDYKDSEAQKVSMEQQVIKNSEVGKYVTVGDCKWKILEFQGNQVLLLKKTALPERAYNDVPGDTTWETSSLRKWLNAEFLAKTFTELEHKKIALSDIKNKDNETYHTLGGSDTKDYIFLLSMEEVQNYSKLLPEFKNNGWLRSPGSKPDSAAFLSVSGKVMDYGYAATDKDEFTVRPALWFQFE